MSNNTKDLGVVLWVASLALLGLIVQPAQAARLALSVSDSLSGHPVPQVNVRLEPTGADAGAPALTTHTDSDGRARAPVQSGRWLITLHHGGYHRWQRELRIGARDTTISITLHPVVYRMPERVAEAVASPSASGVTSISPTEVLRYPSPTPDPLRILRVLPGVASFGDQGAGTYRVRGGNRDENLVTIEGVPIESPHLMRSGLADVMSPINGDMVDDLRLHTGVVDAHLGNRLSSVLEVEYRRPDSTDVTATVGNQRQSVALGTRSGDWRLLLGARRVDLSRLTQDLQVDGGFEPQYDDVQGLLAWGDGAVRADLFGLMTRSRFGVTPTSRTLRTNCSPAPSLPPRGPCDQFVGSGSGDERLEVDTDAVSARLRFEGGGLRTVLAGNVLRRQERDDTDRAYDADWVPRVFRSEPIKVGWLRQQLSSRGQLDLTRWDGSLTIAPITSEIVELGLGAQRTSVEGNASRTDSLWLDGRLLPPAATSSVVERTPIDLHGHVRSRWSGGTWGVDLAARGVRFDAQNEWLALPRARLTARGDGFRAVLAAGLAAQPPLYREFLAAGEEPVSQKGGDVTFEIERQQTTTRWRATLFHRRGWDRMSYTVDDVELLYSGRTDSRTRTVGGEVALRGEVGRAVGSISYTWLKAEENLNDDRAGWLSAPTDQRHTASAYLEDRMDLRWGWLQASRFHIRALYGSGYPHTPSIPVLDDAGQIVGLEPGERNSLRDDAYIRFDIGMTQVVSIAGLQLQVREEVANLFDEFNALSYQQLPTPDGAMERLPIGLGRRVTSIEVSIAF